MSTKKEIAKLTKMKLNELQAKFAEVTGETTRSPNKVFLVRRICEALQAASAKAENVPEAAPDAEVNAQVEPAATTEVNAQTEPASTDGKLTSSKSPSCRLATWRWSGGPPARPTRPTWSGRSERHRRGTFPLDPERTRIARASRSRCYRCVMESAVVDKLDEAWRSRGIKNRMEFFREALGHYLKELGAEDAAALFANDAAVTA
jgi:hypothetical protein